MRILTTLTYYRPQYSGLTIYAERLARALVSRGHQVTVLTSRYETSLLPHEVRDGVEVIRPKVWLRVSKGVMAPGILAWGWKIARQADIVHLHLPQLDAAPIAILCWLLRKPVVITYHCDLRLPQGFVHSVANLVSHLANLISLGLAQAVVTNTRDYAEASPFLRRYLHKLHAIPTPVELPSVDAQTVVAFRMKANVQPGQRLIGMAARLATEKGVEYLVEAMPEVLKRFPDARVLHMGQYQNVMGEENYARKLAPMIQALGKHWTFLGNVSAEDLAAFFQTCEVTVLPSLNSTESFGIVQVEAMSCGTPVVASDLPGVRQPVRMTGMGLVVPPADAPALAKALIEILDSPENYKGDSQAVAQRFSSQRIAEEYETLFNELVKKND
jgi:glycosyltransferase involved in cell wall biosynthesis